MNIVQKLTKQKIITPPEFLPLNTHLLVTMGSIAYGVGTATSDHDVMGFCIPPKGYLFPNLAGYIPGFGHNPLVFEQYQQHGIRTDKKEYDFSIYSIVKYFELCRQNNPNMIDSLYVAEDCILFCTNIGRMVLDNRSLFLSKEVWRKFRGYAYSQLHALDSTNATGKRADSIAKHGYDLKAAYHTVRLLSEVEQLLEYGDMDLRQDKEVLKSIRKGHWTKEQILQFFDTKTKGLEVLYNQSKLPTRPDEARLRQLLIDCLEAHYGNLNSVIGKPDEYKVMVDKIRNIINE